MSKVKGSPIVIIVTARRRVPDVIGAPLPHYRCCCCCSRRRRPSVRRSAMLVLRAAWTLSLSLSLPLTFGALFAPGCPRAPATSSRTPGLRSCAAHASSMAAGPHVKSRCPVYPGSRMRRFPVPDNKVSWETEWLEYRPASYTAPSVLAGPAWADPNIGSFSPRFNALDGTIERRSHEGQYRVVGGKPLNPHGRTGLTERGLLGRWGPNHAADPIVTRWKKDGPGRSAIHSESRLPVLQFVAIMRKDCGEWAIPGGMVDPGERVSLTLQREFSEEALNSLAVSPEERARLRNRIAALFASPGFQVYKGYVDDPRNTDNAWIETVAVNFHDQSGDSVSELPLQAGDDAGQVSWMDIDSSLSYYASHSLFLEMVAKERHGHW